MKKILFLVVFLVNFYFSVAVVHADKIKINDLSTNGISIVGIKFSPLEDIAVCWASDGSIWKSVDLINWNPAAVVSFEGLKNVEPVDQLTLFAITKTSVLVSRNGSISFQNISNKFPSGMEFEKGIYVNEGIYILGKNGKVFRSIDRGENFSDISVSSPCNLRDLDFFRHVDTGYMLGDNSETALWKTTNAGITWGSETLPQNTIGSCISISGIFAFIAGLGDLGYPEPSPLILRVYEGGWEVMPLPESYIPCGIYFRNNLGVMLARKSSSLIAMTSNFGLSWELTEKNIPLYALAINNEFLVTTGDSGTIYLEPLNPTGINATSSVETYSLSQNYPNPFNPETKISFSIPKAGKVALKIYDVTGREVETLVSQVLSPGSYQYSFSARNLTSGTYFYRLETEDFTDTKRMVLVK